MDIAFLISLVSGALGGNVAGALLKQFSLGTLGNSVAGVLGGGLGGKILGGLLGFGAAKAGGLDFGSIIGSVLTGGAGGGALMTIIGIIRSMISK